MPVSLPSKEEPIRSPVDLEVAAFAPQTLKDDLLKALKTMKKKKTRLLGTVQVKKFLGELRIVAVLSWKEAGK